jgi:hypothetical protein
MAKRSAQTRCVGRAFAAPVAQPIRNSPAGITIISGSKFKDIYSLAISGIGKDSRISSTLHIRSPVNDEREGQGLLVFNQGIDEEALAVGSNIEITALLRRENFKQRPHSADL